ncbi:hypothetical protein [Rhodohalobacter mucosus]|uniref:Uncharacterized protein n=1 Tax=Rhodohalobacter mucosus TaxID=2079485 RepID=A0A316TLL7_9BACT|nr:hypothetical protein [Rhodohalobacter mucosus]PWN05280.1 hypothetical protein DDZ15_14475 [Rhodohalobacter mucosus]
MFFITKRIRKSGSVLFYHLSALLMMVIIAPMSTKAQVNSDASEHALEAGVDPVRLDQLGERAVQSGISSEELLRILEPATAMAGENLPYELIFEKAFEGMSKGVPVSRMQPVLASIASSSSQAAGITDNWVQRPGVQRMLSRDGRMSQQRFRNEMIRAGSKGLMQSMDREVLVQTLEEVAGGPALERSSASGIVTAISILSDLPTAASEPAATARMVVSALEGGFESEDLLKLPGAMNMAQRRSRLPAQAVAEGLRRQLQGGSPASDILQNLFNGGQSTGPQGNIPAGLKASKPFKTGSGIF